MRYRRVIEAMNESPWAILPGKLAQIRALMALRVSGRRLSEGEIKAVVEAAQGRPVSAGAEGVAVVPLVGTMIPRADITESSGAVSMQRFLGNFRAAVRDPDVGSVVIDVDSPGGQVGGVDEVSKEIFEARGDKPIFAVANHLAASAAYWVATAADEFWVSPSGNVGSIGVIAMHEDVSGLLEKEGIKVSLISAGRFKSEGSPFLPLDDEAREAIQGQVDVFYDMFVKAVARNRGVKVSDVHQGFGEGRVVGGREAVRLGMADRVGTLDEAIVAAGRSRRKGRSQAKAGVDFRRRRLRANE
jgi:signal peptide peptidase SppA